MARVALLSLSYAPDMVSTANIMASLARGLRARGHDVTVVTSIPHYNPAPGLRERFPYAASILRPVQRHVEEGVTVYRVLMPRKPRWVWRRLLDFLLFHVLATCVMLFSIGKQDVILVTTPPFTLGLIGTLAARRWSVPFLYDLQELWPDVLVRMGLIRPGLVFQLMTALERFIYRQATSISVIAHSFRERLIEKGVPKGKIHYTPSFVDVGRLQPMPRNNELARSLGLTDKFVVLYAGNIGLTQGLELLVDVARLLHDDERIHIVIVGDGAARDALSAAVSRSRVKNLSLLPFQPAAQVPELYGLASVCVIPLKSGCGWDTAPSKLITCMAAGRPVLASIDRGTETAYLVEAANAGKVLPPEAAEPLAAMIREFAANPGRCEELGRNGRRYAVGNFSDEAIIGEYHRMVEDAIARSNSRKKIAV